MDQKRRHAEEIVRRLHEAGFEAYFAGGCVRDMVMGLAPHDYDIATSARPEEVQRLFPRTVPVGAQFGVVIVVADGFECQVATFRTEADYRDGRHPEGVRFATAEEDVRRRDFTINGLLYDPLTESTLDFVGGVDDIRAGRIRTIGDPRERFSEDHLRLMRAVRFAARFQFEIEEATRKALRAAAPMIARVSPERVREELVRILTGPHPDRGLDSLVSTGIMEHVMPEVTRLIGVPQPPEFHPEGDVYTHVRLMFSHARTLTPELAMAVLLHDSGKPDTLSCNDRIRFNGHTARGIQIAEEVCRRLRFSNRESEHIIEMVRDHMRFIHVQEMRPGRLKRFLRMPAFDEHLELHRLDCLGSHGDLSNHDYCVEKLEGIRDEPVPPARLLSGHDLIHMGLRPGPLFKVILEAVEEEQLEGNVRSRDDAVAFVRRRFGGQHTASL